MKIDGQSRVWGFECIFGFYDFIQNFICSQSSTRFNFHSYIDVNHLEYIPKDNVIVAVNSVSFDNSVQPIEILMLQTQI